MGMANAGLSSTVAYQRIQGNNPDGTPNPAYPQMLDVENRLRQFKGVTDAVVVLETDGSHFDAYVAATGLDKVALMQQCQEELPSAMVPTRLCVLDALPRTSNDKVDLAKLPEIDEQAGDADAPSGAVEGGGADQRSISGKGGNRGRRRAARSLIWRR